MFKNLDTRTVLYNVIGVAAFIVGGIVTRTKALETAETVENFVSKKDKKRPEALDPSSYPDPIPPVVE